jgi:hypothetical protein
MTIQQPKAVMICGAGHSGSTLLGLLLDSHSGCFYLGEGAKVRFLGDERKPLRKRACKICGEDCPVWSRFRWDPATALYPSVMEHVGRNCVVDSTKNVAWLRARIHEVEAAGIEATLLLLLRDGRAVINSRLRKYPERDPEQQIVDWMRQIDASRELYDSFSGNRLTLRYEQLASRPEAVMRDVCDIIGIAYEPGMLRFDGLEHHPLGGNTGTQYLASRSTTATGPATAVGSRSRRYYERHPPGIRLDLRWQEEMAAEHLGTFDRVAGGFNEPMAWEATDCPE